MIPLRFCRPSPPSRLLRSLPGSLLCLAASASLCLAQNDNPAPETPAAAIADPAASRVRIAVAHFNFDRLPDTLFGASVAGFRVLPTHIAWGDTARRDADRKARTEFHYPRHWDGFTGNVAVQRFNTDDSLSDILIYFWGRAARNRSRADTSVVDTARAVAIFGQDELDRVGTIDIARIDGLQSEPYFAMDLRAEKKFTQPAKRDMSGRTSYVLERVKLRDGAKPKQEDTTRVKPTEGPRAVVKVYPNPTMGSTQVEATSLASGAYRVEVIAVSGRRVYVAEIEAQEGGGFLEALDLGSLPSGYYVARVYSRERMIGSYPISVVR